ncbi:MAG TPA: DUF6569 family protein, partial [Armatimonadaceae bacterium]|nr:DUF6569 family protein [Armatimonadaceae bacterium]
DTRTYMTLDEGLKAKLVSVVEKGQGGEVNALFITNRAQKPLYLMGGEVVLGGQQDRVLGQDTVIPAGGKSVPVTVFCVEHGRWNGRAEFAGSAKAVASAEIRAVAQGGAYAAKIASPAAVAMPSGVVDPQTRNVAARGQSAAANVPVQQVMGRQQRSAARPAPLGSAQQQVWSKVESKNAKFRAANATGTYRGVLEGSGGSAAASVTPYLKAFSGGLPASRGGAKPVGVVVAVNGKMVTADVFREPGLFAKLWPKLLRAYATDAAEHAAKPGGASSALPACAPFRKAKAVAFLKGAQAGKADTVRENGVALVRRTGKAAVSYRLVDRGGAANARGAVAPLHENVVAGTDGGGGRP